MSWCLVCEKPLVTTKQYLQITLFRTCCHTLRDKIPKKDIIKGLGVTNFEKKMKDNRLRYFCMCKDRELKKKKEYRKLEL